MKVHSQFYLLIPYFPDPISPLNGRWRQKYQDFIGRLVYNVLNIIIINIEERRMHHEAKEEVGKMTGLVRNNQSKQIPISKDQEREERVQLLQTQFFILMKPH